MLRSKLTLLVALLVVVGTNFATSEPASAHADHNCTGVTSSGFSCSRASSNGQTWDERLTYTYYNGSQRTFTRINFLSGRGTIDYVEVCDARKGDNITHGLEVRTATGETRVYSGPVESSSDSCRFYSPGSSYRATHYRVVTYSSGKFSHATVWCRTCVPGG
jgi:hypothetical protein